MIYMEHTHKFLYKLYISKELGVNALFVPTFLFYHFQSLIQLTLVIFVLSVTQLVEKADVANGVHC